MAHAPSRAPSGTRRAACWPLALLLALLASCEAGTPRLVLVVDHVLPFDAPVRELELELWSDRARPSTERLAVSGEWPVARVLVPADSEEAELEIRLRARDADSGALLHVRRVRTHFPEGGTRLLHVVLGACACPVEQSCGARGCEPDSRRAQALPIFRGLPPRASTDCPADVACDGLDTDCDGLVDESAEDADAIDHGRDAQHCGTCGHTCEGSCEAGRCAEDLLVAVAVGQAHVCAANADGRVVCWGDPSFGRLGGSHSPAVVEGVRARELVAGGAHTCALEAEGSVVCWGDSFFGQCGAIETGAGTAPRRVLERAQAIAAGAAHTCAIRDQQALCWGDDSVGQLGPGVGPSSPEPRVISGLEPVWAIAAGGFHTCAIGASGVWCWGAGAAGQLGPGSAVDSRQPVLVPGTSGAVAVTAGVFHSCAASSEGVVRCWGRGTSGELGDGRNTSSAMPVVVSGIAGASALATAPTGAHTCALVGGGASCWGAGSSGQLGDGATAPRANPVAVPIGGIDRIGLGGTTRAEGTTCALRSGALACWGAGFGLEPTALELP